MEQTHERFIHDVVGFARSRLNETEQQAIDDAKIVYGAGQSGLRGVTYFDRWQNGGGPDKPHSFVEICAFGESDHIQIAGTTLHELAHVIAGYGAGHGPDWKAACKRVGLRHAKAAGQYHCLANLSPDVRMQVAGLTNPADGKPLVSNHNGYSPIKPRPCGAVHGVRGGKSRGKGSGSRMLKVSCGDCGYVARVTGKWLATGAPLCPCNHKPMQSD